MSDSNLVKVNRALISVSDKAGIVEFAQALRELGVELLSTGGTYRLLQEQGLEVTEVADYTGFPEMMDGRVKTLHPKVHGGILARRGQDDAVMAEHGIDAIDMVVVNLYPFEATVAKPDCTLEDAIENIDIGGPTMVRRSFVLIWHWQQREEPDNHLCFLHDDSNNDNTRTTLCSRH